MKRLPYVYIIVLLIGKIFAQSQFDPQAYYRFLEENRNLTTDGLLSMYAPPNLYYTETAVETDLDRFNRGRVGFAQETSFRRDRTTESWPYGEGFIRYL